MLSRAQTLQDLRVPPANHLEVQGKRSITPDTALRLALHFNMSPHFWLGLQMDYDLDVARMRLANASGVKWPCLHDAKG
jgi:addiction module HigA family antidote